MRQELQEHTNTRHAAVVFASMTDLEDTTPCDFCGCGDANFSQSQGKNAASANHIGISLKESPDAVAGQMNSVRWW